MSLATTSELSFRAADGWPLGALLQLPASDGPMPAVVTVAGSRHERDAWKRTSESLTRHGVATLLLDVRGRGTSRGDCTYARMGPGQRRLVRLDVAKALEVVAEQDDVDPTRLGVLAEQDTAAEAAKAAVEDSGVRALCLVSPRRADRITSALRQRPVSVFGLVSTEDREGVRAAVGAYLAAATEGSDLAVFGGLGIGITMASVLQFEQPDAEPLEDRIAGWLARRLA